MTRLKEMPLHKKILLISLILVIFAGSFAVFGDAPKRLGDESFHSLQVKRIARGDDRRVVELTNIPGYHYLTAGILTIAQPVLQIEKIKGYHIRAASVFYTIILLGATWYFARRYNKNPYLPLLIVALPVLSSYSFLSYTEGLSVLLLSLALWMHLGSTYVLSATFLLLAILVRQDNIIWIMYFGLAVVFRNGKLHGISLNSFVQIVKEVWAYGVVAALFTIFYFVNGGVAIGDKTAHPTTFTLGNIYYFLILAGIVLLPLIISEQSAIKKLLTAYKYKTLISFSAFGISYIALFHVDHPYNQSLEYLHNSSALFLTKTFFGSLLGIIIAFGSLLYFYVTGRKSTNLIILYAISFLALGLHWLIEIRYAIVPLVFFLIIQPKLSTYVSKFLCYYFLVLSAVLFWIVYIDSHIFL